MKRGHCLYVIKAQGTAYRKVGVTSSNLMVRLANLQVGSWVRLEFQLIVRTETREAAELWEGVCHGVLWDCTTEPCVGEWSHVTTPDKEFNNLLLMQAERLGIKTEVVFSNG